MAVGIWQISDRGPKRMQTSNVELEQHLEDWIAEDTSLLQAGLVVVGRQIYTAGGKLDLLAVDLQGRWVVIEIKRGEVRRDTVAQAIDYASCIVDMDADELRTKTNNYLSQHAVGNLRTLDEVLEQRGLELNDEEEREVTLIVVGTAQDAGLERMVNFLAERGSLHVTVVSFDVFALPSGEQVLVRELTESDENAEPVVRRSRRKTPSLEELFEIAEARGVGGPFRQLVEHGVNAGLYPRCWAKSVMLAPQENKTRCLVVVSVNPTRDGHLKLYVELEAFTEFYGIPESQVKEQLGGIEREWLKLNAEEVEVLADRLNNLMRQIQGADEA